MMAERGKDEREGPKKGGMEGSFAKDLQASAILSFILCLGFLKHLFVGCMCVCVRAYARARMSQ